MIKAGFISFISGCGKSKYLLFKLLLSGKNLKDLQPPFLFKQVVVVAFRADWFLHVLYLQEIQEEMKKHGHEPVKFLDVKVMIKREDGLQSFSFYKLNANSHHFGEKF